MNAALPQQATQATAAWDNPMGLMGFEFVEFTSPQPGVLEAVFEKLGFNIPGIGVVMTLLIILVTGLVAANVLGQKLVKVWESLLARIPVVKSIYYSVKQVSDTLFSSSGQAFRKALLVQYPREGAWTIAFLTGKPGGDAARHLKGDYVSVYVPTTPNPTSGFFLMMPKKDVIELDMSVDEALKYIISMGVVAPPSRRSELPALLNE